MKGCMTSFVALYRGRTISEAKMISVSAEPALVNSVATQMLAGMAAVEDLNDQQADDPVIDAIESGRKTALRFVTGGAE